MRQSPRMKVRRLGTADEISQLEEDVRTTILNLGTPRPVRPSSFTSGADSPACQGCQLETEIFGRLTISFTNHRLLFLLLISPARPRIRPDPVKTKSILGPSTLPSK